MEKQIQMKSKTAKVAISLQHNERLNELLLFAKKEEPLARLTKQRLLEYAIDKISDEEVFALSKKYRDRKKIILHYLKQDQKLSNPQALIALLQDELGIESSDSLPPNQAA